MTYTLNATHRACIATRVRCPQSRDDIAQSVLLALWQIDAAELN